MQKWHIHVCSDKISALRLSISCYTSHVSFWCKMLLVVWRPSRGVSNIYSWRVMKCEHSRCRRLMLCEHPIDRKSPEQTTESHIVWTPRRPDDSKNHVLWAMLWKSYDQNCTLAYRWNLVLVPVSTQQRKGPDRTGISDNRKMDKRTTLLILYVIYILFSFQIKCLPSDVDFKRQTGTESYTSMKDVEHANMPCLL